MEKPLLKGLVLALGIAVAGVVVHGMLPGNVDAAPGQYKTATAQHRKITSTIIADGRVAFEDEIAVSSEVIAKVASIQVRPGDQVQAGQVLLVLDDKQIATQVAQRQFSFDASTSSAQLARAALALADEKVKRMRPLASKSYVSANDLEIKEKELEQAREALKAALSNQQLAGAALQESRELLRKSVIRSPIEGTVLSVDTSVGETAVPSTQSFAGTALVRIAKMGQLLVKADIGEADIARVQVGQEAKVFLPALNNAWVGARLEQIALAANSNAASGAGDGAGRGQVTFQVTFALQGTADPAIRTGMSCRVELPRTSAARDMLAVPVEAVRPAPGAAEDKFVVWRVRSGGKPEPVNVTLGLADDAFQEVSGLEDGDRVITGPSRFLVDLESGSGANARDRRDAGN